MADRGTKNDKAVRSFKSNLYKFMINVNHINNLYLDLHLKTPFTKKNFAPIKDRFGLNFGLLNNKLLRFRFQSNSICDYLSFSYFSLAFE